MQKSPQTQPLPPPSITTGCREGGLSLDSRNLLNWGCSAPEVAPSPPAVTLSPAACPSFPSASHQAPGKVEVGAGTHPPQHGRYRPRTLGAGRCPPPAAPAPFTGGVSNAKIHSVCFILIAPRPISELPNRMSCHVIFICTVLQMPERWLGSRAKLDADLKEYWPVYHLLP